MRLCMCVHNVCVHSCMYIWCAWQTTTRFASDQAICALAHATRSNSNFHELSLFSTDLKDEGALALLLALESNPNVRFADPQRHAGANQCGEGGSCILFLCLRWLRLALCVSWPVSISAVASVDAVFGLAHG